MPEEEVKIERAEEPLQVRFVSNIEFLQRAARRIGRSISDYIPRVAVPISPYRFAARHVFYTILSIPPAVAAIPLALVFHLGFLAMLVAPFVTAAVPWLKLKAMIGDRKRAVDGELPFFTIHAAIAQSAGLNLYESLCSTIGEGVFKQIERGASHARRNSHVLGMSPLRAIENLGRNHPHRGMESLLLGYTSESRSGGDVASYLHDKAESFLRRARRRWDEYLGNVSTIAEVILASLFVFPILVLMAAFLAPDAANSLGIGFSCLGIPLLMAGCVAAIRSSQPKDYTRYEGNIYLAILAVPLTFSIVLCFSPPWIALSLAATVGFFAYGLPVLIQRRRALREMEPLPQFLRDVTEYQKLDYSLNKTIAVLWKEKKYTAEFNQLIGHAVKQLKMGRRFSELDLPARSWLTRLAFFHLGQVAETGGVAARSMELLTDFITRVKEARDEVRSSLRLYRALALITPIILTLIVGLMEGVLGSIQMPEAATSAAGFAPQVEFGTPSEFRGVSRSIVMFSSIGVSFLTSYASDFTAKNTVWIALNAFLATVAIVLLPRISELMAGLLGF